MYECIILLQNKKSQLISAIFFFLPWKTWADLPLELEKHDICVWAMYFSKFEKSHKFSLPRTFFADTVCTCRCVHKWNVHIFYIWSCSCSNSCSCLCLCSCRCLRTCRWIQYVHVNEHVHVHEHVREQYIFK